MRLRLLSLFIKPLCTVLLFGGTTHTGRVRTATAGKFFVQSTSSRAAVLRQMSNYLGMLIALLSSKRKPRNRLGSSLFSLPSKLVQRCVTMPLVQCARKDGTVRTAGWDSVRN